MGLFALTPEEGADNSIYLATSQDVAGVTGKYFVKREPAQSSSLTYDEELAKRLWEVSEDLTSIAQTGSGARHQTISIQSGA
jgi:hypothetical protein